MKNAVAQVSKELNISRAEAELIVAALLEKPRFELYLKGELDEPRRRALKIKIMQLRKGIPLEYLTKKVQFLNYTLNIYPGVFIPRLETEYFVEIIGRLVKKTPVAILEIGTGSGALAIALSSLFPKSSIIATDISPAALSCARQNIKQYNLEKQIKLVRGDMLNAFSTPFDLIVSNPPYIPDSRLKSLPDSVKYFEPILAIAGGKNGIDFTKRMLLQAVKQITPDGMIAVEIDEDAVDPLKDFIQSDLSAKFLFKKDLFNRNRYLFIGNFNNEKSKDSN